MTATLGKRIGRKGRLAQRAVKPALDPCPPGQPGGSYKPLTEAELERIYSTALDLLDKLGMGEVPQRLRDDFMAIGVITDHLRCGTCMISRAFRTCWPISAGSPGAALQPTYRIASIWM